MKFLRFASFLFVALLVLLAEKDACAQWKEVAPGLMTPISLNYNGSAIHFKDGVVWVGWGELWNSLDSGRTWQKKNFPASNFNIINDIHFYDRFTGLIAAGNGIYITHDGGDSWSLIGNFSGSWSAIFGKKATSIYSFQNQPSAYHFSSNGGLTWTNITLPVRYPQHFTVTNNDVIYMLIADFQEKGNIYYSTDEGMTWNYKGGSIDGDCYSIATDSCDSKRLCIVNENRAWPGNGNSKIYISSDEGNSWNETFSRKINYLTGSLASTTNAIYVGAQNNVLRSLDHGLSWKEFSAPSQKFDTHGIASLDNNIMFLLDINGNVWQTMNSMGDPVFRVPKNSDVETKSLFALDTIDCNGSKKRSIAIVKDGCVPLSIMSWQISGQDSISYGAEQPSEAYSLDVTFNAKHAGNNRAILALILDDGTIDTVLLKGYNLSKPYTYSTIPANLFRTDSIYICLQENKTLILAGSGCMPNIISQSIVGIDANDYHTIRQLGSPLDNFDSVIISFSPKDSGSRSAIYEINLDNGTRLSIPLLGYGIPQHPLFLETSDEISDTLGGSLNVPITISGLDHLEDIDLVLHYDKELIYHGSYSPANIQLDIPNEQWTGRSKLHIPQAKPNTIVGYARFDVFNDSNSKSKVTFDSVTVLTAVSPCQYILPASVTSTITGPSGCGIQTISQFMHGILPQLSIIPNPTNGEVTIASTGDLGECSVAIYDMLGNQKGMSMMNISQNTPAKLTLPQANGVYNVRVRSGEKSWDLRVVVSK